MEINILQYIVYKRFKGTSIGGDVNLPVFTICEELDGIIFYNDIPICAITSENAHLHFACNVDAQGMSRGKLIQAIQRKLKGNKFKPNYQDRWDKIWDDKLCQKYKRIEHKDHWLWNHDFYNAPIGDLEYIANLIGAKI